MKRLLEKETQVLRTGDPPWPINTLPPMVVPSAVCFPGCGAVALLKSTTTVPMKVPTRLVILETARSRPSQSSSSSDDPPLSCRSKDLRSAESLLSNIASGAVINLFSPNARSEPASRTTVSLSDSSSGRIRAVPGAFFSLPSRWASKRAPITSSPMVEASSAAFLTMGVSATGAGASRAVVSSLISCHAACLSIFPFLANTGAAGVTIALVKRLSRRMSPPSNAVRVDNRPPTSGRVSNSSTTSERAGSRGGEVRAPHRSFARQRQSVRAPRAGQGTVRPKGDGASPQLPNDSKDRASTVAPN